MSLLNIKIGGLSMLIASRSKKSGEIAMINPSRPHLTENDKKIAANHLPLLVVRRRDVANLDSTPDEFALEQSIHHTWVEAASESDLQNFVGWSVQGYEIKVWPHVAGATEFQEPEITAPKGCNPDTSTWNSLQWVANINKLYPNLKLDPQWRESPHVAARFVLGKGAVTGTKPVGQGGGRIKIAFGESEPAKKSARAFTDAIVYQTESTVPAILVTSESNRWVVKFKPETKQVDAWLLSLDDQSDETLPASLDHFVLYSLLPWRFGAPTTVDFCPGDEPVGHTDGPCIDVQFFED